MLSCDHSANGTQAFSIWIQKTFIVLSISSKPVEGKLNGISTRQTIVTITSKRSKFLTLGFRNVNKACPIEKCGYQ